MTISNSEKKRSCNGCTKCCEGWLTCNIYGNEVKPGKPCFYLKDQSCSIYKTRPSNPCRTFECLWLSQPDLVPENFWPAQSGVILFDRKTKNGNPYLSIHDAGNSISTEILDWAVQLIQYNVRTSIMYEINGRIRFLSSDRKFVEEITEDETSREKSIMEEDQ